MRLTGTKPAVAVATAVLLAGGAVPAYAAGGVDSPFSSHAGVGIGVDDAPPPISGYDIVPKRTVTTGSAIFTVPEVSCEPGELSGVGIGMGVEDVIGAPTTLVDVFVACLDGAPYYQLDALANGVQGPDSVNVSAGDKITVAYVVKGSNLTVTVADLTTGEVVAATGPAPNDDNLTFGAFPLFAGSEDPLPTPDFAKTVLAKMKVNGTSVTKAEAVKSDGNPDIKLGKLKAKKLATDVTPLGTHFAIVHCC
jgi:hypothetical protein